MKSILIVCVLIAVGWQLTEKKPGWFLSALTHLPFINTAVELDLKNVSENISEQAMVDEFDHLFFRCAGEPSRLGDRVCYVHISEFNGIKASDAAFFFDNDRFRYLRISFPVEEHKKLIAYLNNSFKKTARTAGSKEMFGQPLRAWKANKGILATFESEPIGRDETLLTWISFSKIIER